MSILPGWDSVESSGAIAHALHISAIVVLGLLVVAEGLALVYDSHNHHLIAGEQQQKDKAAETTIAELRAGQTQRRLTAAQKTSLITALSPFPGQKISLMTLGNDSEAKDFATDFLYSLTIAKWDSAFVYTVPARENPTGLTVLVNDNELAGPGGQPPPAAIALVKELVEFNVLVGTLDRFEIHGDRGTPPGTITLRIGGKKPPRTSVK
jgi:hypothetical protein